MPARILIVGFQRSGTTLLRRLVSAHPDVAYVIHEGRLLWKSHQKEKVAKAAKTLIAAQSPGISCDIQRDTWGDKVPFCTDKSEDALEYCGHWHRMFGKKAKVLVIIRHPYDVAESSSRTFRQRPDSVVRAMSHFMPGLLEEALKDHALFLPLKFERLVTQPRLVMKEVFAFCGVDLSDDVIDQIAKCGRGELRYFDGIEADRAFAYQRQPKWDHPHDLTKCLKWMNRVPGPTYEA